ncbi:hypothetical protein T08_14248 [Trichinella sp. T8]|nr:hypothetical protein T08_14248 [Trichinella sp. T8]
MLKGSSIYIVLIFSRPVASVRDLSIIAGIKCYACFVDQAGYGRANRSEICSYGSASRVSWWFQKNDVCLSIQAKLMGSAPFGSDQLVGEEKVVRVHKYTQPKKGTLNTEH